MFLMFSLVLLDLLFVFYLYFYLCYHNYYQHHHHPLPLFIFQPLPSHFHIQSLISPPFRAQDSSRAQHKSAWMLSNSASLSLSLKLYIKSLNEPGHLSPLWSIQAGSSLVFCLVRGGLISVYVIVVVVDIVVASAPQQQIEKKTLLWTPIIYNAHTHTHIHIYIYQ